MIKKMLRSLSIRRLSSSIPPHFVISPPVQKALNQGRGVVALESTVITHGLPYPHNIETARSMEHEVRSQGSEPATIAILDGKVHIGLSEGQLGRVADSMDSIKVSRRDIPYALHTGVVGGTTVAATMYLSHLAGIRVFATGGIGGVHRGAENTFDISADLLELSRTPVTVVCAGVKSILDIGKTVEYLETHSVPTIVFGSENVFPGFFSAKSEAKGQLNTEKLEEVADIIALSSSLSLPSGHLLACPIPSQYQADGLLIEQSIQRALQEAQEGNIRSQQITPFLLKRVNELTQGASMKTNIALLLNNARIGGRLARLLAEKSMGTQKTVGTSGQPGIQTIRSTVTSSEEIKKEKKKPQITVIGATIIDFEAITSQSVQDDGGSYVGYVTQRMGGVGRNHADALTRLGCSTRFISAIGEDSNGEFAIQKCAHMDFSLVSRIPDLPSATYLSMNVGGVVRYGISSIGDIVNRITPNLISDREEVIASSDYLLLDGNLPTESIGKAIDIASFHSVPVWFEPTDIAKVRKVFDCGALVQLGAASPNANEFRQWAKMSGVEVDDSSLTSPTSIGELVVRQPHLMHNLSILLVSLAHHGTVVIRRGSSDHSLCVSTLPAPSFSGSDQLVSVSGAGDSLNSGILGGILHGLEWADCLELGQECARKALMTTEAVAGDLSVDMVERRRRL